MSTSDRSPLEPRDVQHLRGLAGVGFLSPIRLPSGRVMAAEEAQALADVYAPAADETRRLRAETNHRVAMEPYDERQEPRFPILGALLLYVTLIGMVTLCSWMVISRWPA